MYRQKTLDGESEEFLNPNKLSEDGLVSLELWKFSEDGEYMAYGLSESGSDWKQIKVCTFVTFRNLFPKADSIIIVWLQKLLWLVKYFVLIKF